MKVIEAKYFELFKRPLSTYKQFKVIKRINPQAYVLLLLFVLVLSLFIVELFNVIDKAIVTIPFLIVVTVLCLVGPIIYIFYYKRQNVVFTEKAIFKQTYKNDWVGIPFSKVQRMLTDHEKRLVLISDDKKIALKFSLYESDLKEVLTILKYRGFFNEKPLDYEVIFENNKIRVEELIGVMNQDTSHLFEKYINKYNFLTPGFFEEIIFYNNQISRIQLTEAKHVVFYLSHLDIKPNHPENTKFKAQKTDEAIVIFENVQDVEVLNISGENDRETILGINIQTLRDTTKNAIIFEAETKEHEVGLHIEFIMSHGVKKQRVRFAFTEVIVGWNKLVENSWFEK
jgi:hypothetical protein